MTFITGQVPGFDLEWMVAFSSVLSLNWDSFEYWGTFAPMA
jgi:hypothetical protein